MVQKAKQAEGIQNVGSMNRAQQAYFLENNEFADSVPEVGIGIPTQTQNYQYSIRATPLAVFNYATPREKNIKGYVGAVFVTSGDEATDEIVTVGLMCETKSPGWLPNWFNIPRPAAPIVRGNVIECAPNTQPSNYHNSPEPIVLGKDSALAYSSLNYAVAGQYDQALQVAETIENDSVKQRALDAIANYRKSP
jgi:hypothetical protein